MQISLIAACDQNRLIGSNNQLPWRLPADLQHFKKLTLNKPVLMGRLTYESIGHPLPQRPNLVLSRQADYQPDGVKVVASLEAAIAAAATASELMVIGGSQLYQLCLPMASRIYLTQIDASFSGDSWFPEFDTRQWREISHTIGTVDERNIWPHRFICFERIATIALV